MKKERKDIALGAIQLNTGQVDWLPANPRTWTQSDIDDTRDSILEDPDFLEDRPLLVVPFGKAFVAFAGNLRHEGATAAKLSKVPCVVYHPETSADYETILRRAMKDNGQFGKTNWDAIYSSKWGTLPLEKWGLTPKGWTEPEGGEGEEGENGGGVAPGSQRPDTGVRGSLAQRFVIPPFTVLDTRKGEWKARKAEWRERIADNGESRENTLAGGGYAAAGRILLDGLYE